MLLELMLMGYIGLSSAYALKVYEDSKPHYRCNSVNITKTFIITAAHCAVDTETKKPYDVFVVDLVFKEFPTKLIKYNLEADIAYLEVQGGIDFWAFPTFSSTEDAINADSVVIYSIFIEDYHPNMDTYSQPIVKRGKLRDIPYFRERLNLPTEYYVEYSKPSQKPFPGISGSPVFNAKTEELIGIHHGTFGDYNISVFNLVTDPSLLEWIYP
jgi:hypothetical protein